MNEKGQFLLYDAILGLIILLIILLLVGYIIEENQDTNNNLENFNKPLDTLNLLSYTYYNGEKNVLYYLSESIDENNSANINESLNMISSIISSNTKYDYTFSDITNERITLIDTNIGEKREVFSGIKIINNHIFEIKYYVSD